MAIIGKRIVTEEDRVLMARKEREERRKKFLKASYGKKKPKHSAQGVKSCIYGGCVLAVLAMMLILSYMSKGDINILFGFLGLFVMFASYKGLRNGIKGLKELNKNYITCRWGIGLNGVVLFGLIAMFVRGLM